MMYKRYEGEFVSTYGTVWRVEIHEEAEAAGSPGSEGAQAPASSQEETVGELSFPYDEPLLIEWEKRAKEEVIQGSSATLKLISPGDRTYVDLYSVKPCAVRLDVYRAGALYWRGTLDTELYEEPYESASGYTVSLTFSDFGVLARKKLYGHEVQSLRSILERALEAAGLAGMEIYDGYISSRLVPAARLVPVTNGPTGADSQAAAGALPVDEGLYVKVTAELLLDARSNPFETAGEWMEGARERTYQEQWNRYGNFVYVPVCVKWKDAGGKTWCWDNRQEVQAKAPAKLKSLGSTLGEWKEYTESDGKPGVWGYLAYYSGSDRENTAGVANGWAKNRPGINPHSGQVTTQLSKCEGAYVPCPAGGGELWVEVLCGGWTAADQGCDFDKTYHSTDCGFWDEYESAGRWKIRHVWMKLPEVEMVRARAFDEALDDSDITYSAELEPEAEEALEIETICGSAAGGVPGARGVYLTADGAQVTEITRGGYTGQIEELLIGTLYSQYARRHTTLSGRLLAGSNGATPAGCDRGAMGASAASSQASSQVGGLCVYFDRCMTDARLVPETNSPTGANQQVMPTYGYKAFVMSSSAEDVRAGTTEIEVTEFTLDEYVKVETDDNEEEEQ